MSNLSDWDLDFSKGLKGENLVADIVKTAEVKTDFQWQKTGNLYVEYECWYNNEGKFKPSGIAVSKAEYWSFVIPVGNKKETVLSIPISMLKKICLDAPKVEMNNGANPSKGYLVKISQVFGLMMNEAA